MGKKVTRLYAQFQPESYTIAWQLDERAKHFSGHVKIVGRKTGRPSSRITFHANGLKVTSATIHFHDKKGARELSVSRINHQKSLHEVRLHSEDMLYPGQYSVEMDFDASITDSMTGIYPCYFKEDEVEKMLIATQFESHHAREAFPCIDEPEAKAIFHTTLITRTGIQVLGNTPVNEQTVNEGRLTTSFEPTPKMSCYLLAFVCGDMHAKEATTKNGTLVRVWSTTAQPKDSLDFGLDVATRSIEYFEDYFGVAYPLAKADHVALPDFSSGAMENWGLITYRERVLLAYPDNTGQSTLEQIALVIAHETSHQWFGNLVTMRWWDDLWLNESFANMMEYQAVDSMFPEWHVWDSFVAAEGLSALRRDAVFGVQSVHSEVRHPDEISTLFDPSIVYAKGGRLLYMLKNYIGDEAFRKGLSEYFTSHAYSNTVGGNLWSALSDASDKDISGFMDPWLMRPGFPMISASLDHDKATIRQTHFLDDTSKADPSLIWPVPLFADDGKLPRLLETPEEDIPGITHPFLLDPHAYGHYILNYTTSNLAEHALEAVRMKTLPEPGRLMLINSNAMLARAGHKSYATVLTMLDAYREEESEPVWDIMALVTGEVRRFIDVDDTLEKPIRAFSGSLAATQTARLGWQERAGESAADIKLRGLVLGLSIFGEDPKTLTMAKSLFEDYKSRGTSLPPELRSLIMVVPVQSKDHEAFDFLLTQHDKTTNSDLKSDICDALTSTREPAQAERLLTRLKDPKLTKPQDVDRWIVYLLRNRYTRATAWQWLTDNWDWLEETFKADKSYDYLPRYAASCVSTDEYRQKYHALFEPKLTQTALRRNIQLGFEEIDARIAWLSRDIEDIRTFFTQQ